MCQELWSVEPVSSSADVLMAVITAAVVLHCIKIETSRLPPPDSAVNPAYLADSCGSDSFSSFANSSFHNAAVV